jgi:hypothetical protein
MQAETLLDCSSSSSSLSSEGSNDDVYLETQCCLDNDRNTGDAEAGSVACIYTQLVCVTAFILWFTVSGAK